LGNEFAFYIKRCLSKKEIPTQLGENKFIVIPEGGYGTLGLKGMKDLSSEIMQEIKPDYLITALGTGTTALGLIQSYNNKTIGILTLKIKRN